MPRCFLCTLATGFVLTLLFAASSMGEADSLATGSALLSPGQGDSVPSVSDASGASEGLREALEDEKRRAQVHLEKLEDSRRSAEAESLRESSDHESALEDILALGQAVAASPPGSSQADAVYESLVASLQVLRPRLAQALDLLALSVEVPVFDPALDPAVRAAPALATAVARLDSMIARIPLAAEGVQRTIRQSRWTAVELRGLRVERLNALRIECLEKVSDEKRRSLLSPFSRPGVAQAQREINQLWLSARLYRARRLHEVGAFPEQMRNLFQVGTLTWALLKVLAVILAGLWVRSRWENWIERTRRVLFPRLHGNRSKRSLETVLGALQVIGPWTLFLVGLELARRALGSFARLPEISLLYQLAVAYGALRLGTDAAYALIVSAAGRYRLSLDTKRREKLFLSIRAVARLTVAMAIFLSLSGLFLGKGYLHAFVVRLAWILGTIVALRLLAGWKDEICDAYLDTSPSGRLAHAVRRTRAHWYGIFVAAASFGLLAGHAAVVLAKDFALGFDQTRRALAFLFRRRIEKRAELQGYAESREAELPASLVAVFAEEPVRRKGLAIDHFPGFELLEQCMAEWGAGRSAGAFLVTGEPGIGKTSWLGRIGGGEVPPQHLSLNERPRTPAELIAQLSQALLGVAKGTSDPLVLKKELAAGPPRVVTVDLGQNLFLSRVGGYGAFETFVDLLDNTADRVFWVCSFNVFAWLHLSAVRPDLSVFRHRQNLTPWSEAHIQELIRTRLDASGVQANYEDLAVDRMEGVSAQATLLQTEEAYSRLLWDYADGNPRVALYFWLRSAVPESDRRVRIRLFRAPNPDLLEGGGETGLFVLAALVNHENLTLRETSETTTFSPELCRIHLHRFQELGALQEAAGRYRVTTRWQRAAVRLLRRRNLLPD